LDEGLHAYHQQGLVDYVEAVEVKDATDLFIKGKAALDRLAAKVASDSSLGVSALLWKIRNGSPLEYDLKNLDLVRLSLIEKSLMAKLLLVSKELIKRYSTVTGLAHAERDCKVFADGVARRIKLNIILEDEFARVLKPEVSKAT
jgi:hypothetical protein